MMFPGLIRTWKVKSVFYNVFFSSNTDDLSLDGIPHLELELTVLLVEREHAKVVVAREIGKPPKNKNNKGQNQGNKNQNSRGKKHSSVPEDKADKMCDRHYRHGGDAWYCLAPSSCPWKDRCKPRD